MKMTEKTLTRIAPAVRERRLLRRQRVQHGILAGRNAGIRRNAQELFHLHNRRDAADRGHSLCHFHPSFPREYCINPFVSVAYYLRKDGIASDFRRIYPL